MSNSTVILSIVISSLITIALRFAPFLLLSGKKTPDVIVWLGKVLPYAIMGMLVVYCLRGTTFSALSGYIPALAASAVTVISYLIKKNSLVSIVLGTVCYMLLVQFVF